MDIKIYGKKNCTYCDAAKALLNSKQIPYTYELLGANFTVEEIKAQFPAARSYPIVTLDGDYIGGLSELRTKLSLLEQLGGGRQLLNEG